MLCRRDFEQYGIHLPPEEQEQLNELHAHVHYVSTLFSENAAKPPEALKLSAEMLHSLPAALRSYASQVRAPQANGHQPCATRS